MQLKTAEHYEIIEFFDRQYPHMRLDKESKELWVKGRVYQNDEANNLFLAFRSGVAYGKAVATQ